MKEAILFQDVRDFGGFNFKLPGNELEITDNFDYFASSVKIKILFINIPVEVMVCLPHADLREYFISIRDKIFKSDHTFINTTELYAPSEMILQWLNDECIDKNITVFTPTLHKVNYDNLKIVFNPCWILESILHIRYIPEVRDICYQLNSYDIKPKLFDILFGQRRYHRDYIFEMVNNSSMKDQVIMNYRSDANPKANQNYFLDEPGVELFTNPNDNVHSSFNLKYYGLTTCMSSVVPFTIYRQTAYSVVAETTFDYGLTLMSEKTWKPMVGKRLFVAFAGRHHLANLRKLRFKTFDGIIDESYDDIEHNYLRWIAAYKQLEWLAEQPQEKIYQLIKPIVEHNFELITNVANWPTSNEFFTIEVKKLINL